MTSPGTYWGPSSGPLKSANGLRLWLQLSCECVDNVRKCECNARRWQCVHRRHLWRRSVREFSFSRGRVSRCAAPLPAVRLPRKWWTRSTVQAPGPTSPSLSFLPPVISAAEMSPHPSYTALHCTLAQPHAEDRSFCFFFCASFSFATVSLVRAVAYLAGFAYVLP